MASDLETKQKIWSLLETNINFSLTFWRPKHYAVSTRDQQNLRSQILETTTNFGLKFEIFGDQIGFRSQISRPNPDPVSIRDQEDFGLQGGFNIREGSEHSETKNLIGLKIKLETKCFGFKMQLIQRSKFGFGLHLRPITYSVSNHKKYL